MRAVAAHPHRTAAGLFALVIFAYLWPVLVGGQILLPTALLYQLTPWRGSIPSDVLHYFNSTLEDVPLSYYPWDVLARRLLHAGTFPAWNPYAFAGTPFFANAEVAWLSPFSLPLWILPLNYGIGVAAAIKLWFAGLGSYLLVRELKLGFWPGVLAGISYALCAFNIVWLSHSVFVSVAAMLPWCIWLVERIVRRGRSVDGLALTAVVAVVLASGHPGTQLHVLAGTVLYALVRAGLGTADDAGEPVRRERLRRLGLVGAALAVGAMLTAVVLLPAEEAANGTTGSFARSRGGVGLPGSTMPFSSLRTVLLPDWWGRLSALAQTPNASYLERTFYAGTVAFVLALLGLVSSTVGGWRRKAPFALLGVLGAAVALRAPGLYEAVTQAPLFKRVQDQRLLLWFQFAVAVLAAFGLQALLDAPRRQRRAWLAVLAALLFAVVTAAGVGIGGEGVLSGALHYFKRRAGQQLLPAAVELASIGWCLVFVLGLGVALLLARRFPARPWLLGGLVALLAAADMLHFAHGFQPIGPASQVIPPKTPAVAYLQRHAGEGRIAGVEFALANDYSTVYGLRDARGYDAPQPSLRFRSLWLAMEVEQPVAGSYRFENLAPLSLSVLGVLGTRYIVTEPGTRLPPGLLTRVYSGPDATIFRNTLAMGPAIVPSQTYVAMSDNDEVSAVARAGFDPRRFAVVRADEVGAAVVPQAGSGSARVIAEENARVTVRARLAHAGVVVLDDAWAPGWSVTVDGRPARALQADVVLRGVVVPAGVHRVVWSYRVPGLRAGAVVSALGLLLVLGWGGWLVRRARRARSRVVSA